MLLSAGQEPDKDGFRDYLYRRGLSPSTVRNYLQWVAVEEPLVCLRSDEWAPKSRRVIKAALCSYARFSGDEDLLEELSDIRLPPSVRSRPQHPLPKECFDALRKEIATSSAIDEPSRAHLGIMAGRGLRKTDVLRISRREAEEALSRNVLSVETKGRRRLEFGVTKNYRDYLEILVECFRENRGARTVANLLGSGSGAEQRPPRMLRKLAQDLPLDKWRVELGDVRCHILRRTYATLFYEACGRDPVRLKDHMQWARLETAAAYVDHSRRQELDELAETMFQ